MPVFTIPTSSQNTSYSAGLHSFPQIGQCQQYAILVDEFQREGLQPTNAYLQYSTGGVGTPVITLDRKNLGLTTSATGNDNTSVRTSGLAFARNSRSIQIDPRANLELDVIFDQPSTTSVQYFVGIVDQGSALTGLPTTVRHMGVYVDTSVDNKLRISSSNGTTQVKTDTGIDITSFPNSDSTMRLNIQWTGKNTATINLYLETSLLSYDFSTLQKSVSVTAFNVNTAVINPELHFFVQTLTIAAKSVTIVAWKCALT